MSSETNEQRMQRLADEERAMTAVRSVCDSYAVGGMSFRQAMRQIEQVVEDQTDRIVRIGNQRHTPEVTT